MHYPIMVPRRRNRRAFVAALLSYLLLAGQVMPVTLAAAARRQPEAAAKAAPAPQPLALAPNIVATKTDSFNDPNNNGKAEPGDTISYTVTISNTGTTDATNVTFNDTVDPNTSITGGSINVQPITGPDIYAASGNIPISLAAPGVLSNDRDPDNDSNSGLTVTKVQGSGSNVGVATDTTAVGRGSVKGSVTLNSNGSFTYEPPPGFEGADTFTYEVGDGTTFDTNTVTINITGMVWFIQTGAAGSNQGTFSNPFTTIAAFNTANTGTAPNAKAGDFIALRSGAYAETDGVNLLNTQKLIGNAVQFNTVFTAAANSSSAYTTFASSTGTAPTISTTGGNGIDLALDNTVRGLNVGNTGNFFDINGAAVGSPVINTVSLTGTGGAINVSTSGSFGSNVTFGTLESTGSAGPNLNLVGVTGSITMTSPGSGFSGSAATFPAVSVNGGGVSFTYTGNVTKATTGALFSAAGGHNGNITFQTGNVSATAGTGLQFDNADGNYTFNGPTTAMGGGDAGIDILNGSDGSFTFGTGASITSPTGTAFNVNGGTPTVTYSGSITQNNNARVVDIQNTTADTITFQTGTVTGGASSTGVNINAANGNVTFSNGMTMGNGAALANRMTNQAVTITGGTGTYSLGAVSIFTNGVQGLVATNADGTLNASGTINSTAASAGTNAAAINIDGPASLTTLGLNFTAVSANNATNGILVRDANGSFAVTGTSTTDGTGGTISNITNRGASFISTGSVSLSNMTFTNVGTANGADPTQSISTCGDLGPAGGGNLACNAGIHLESLTGATLTNVDMNGGNQVGINGNAVTNFVLSNSNVLNFGDQVREDGLKFRNMLGTSSITNTTVSGNEAVQVHVENTSGTLTHLKVINSTISTSAAPNGSHGILFDTHDTAYGKLIVQGVAFSNLFSNCIDALSTSSSGGMDVVVNGNPTAANIRNSFNGCGASGVTIAQNGAAPVGFNIFNHGTLASPTFLGGTSSSAININQAGGTPSTAVMQGAITNNFIGNTSSGTSSTGGDGITAATIAPGTLTVAINNNLIRGAGANGIRVQMREETNNAQRLNLTLLNNDALVTNDPNGFDGIHVVAGTLSGDAGTMCAEINNNDGGTIAAGNDWTVRQRFSTTFQLRGYTGANNNNAAVQTHLDVNQTNDPTGPGVDWFISNNVAGGGGGFVNTPGGAQCTQPNPPAGTETSSPDVVPVTASNSETEETASTPSSGGSNVTSQPFVLYRQPAPAPSNTDGGTGGSTEQSAAASDAPTGEGTPGPLAVTVNGDQITVTLGTLAAGDSVTITFDVTVDNPYSGPSNVSNQGSVSYSESGTPVLTDDPDVAGAANPTLTPINSIKIAANDAVASELPSGTNPMVFTVTLSDPASGTVTVNYATADDTGGTNPATGGGACGASVDYESTSGTLTFNAGERVKTVSVNVCNDTDSPEQDETLLLSLSSPAGGDIIRPQAVGTIRQANPPGTFIISEIRTSGPAGSTDEFVELYNNTDNPLTIAASDSSAGYGVFKMGADCAGTPVLVGTVPNGTVIPARGHYLLVGSAYSLANYGGTGAAAGDTTLTSDIENDRNVAVFTTADLANISTAARLDAVGFGANTGQVCDLMREGTTLPAMAGSTLEYSFFRDECGKSGNIAAFGPCPSGFNVVDFNVNATDFIFADTTGASTPAGQRLGAPGPQNLASPIQRNSTMPMHLLDNGQCSTCAPNRVRVTGNDGTNTNGTIHLRRRVQNNTGGNVTRLRFRIVDVTTTPAPGTADVRARNSSDMPGVSITNDSATCGGPTSCTVTVKGTTVETPPAQPLGGAFNSTWTVTLGSPLSNGQSVFVNMTVGVMQGGNYRIFVNVEALP